MRGVPSVSKISDGPAIQASRDTRET